MKNIFMTILTWVVAFFVIGFWIYLIQNYNLWVRKDNPTKTVVVTIHDTVKIAPVKDQQRYFIVGYEVNNNNDLHEEGHLFYRGYHVQNMKELIDFVARDSHINKTKVQNTLVINFFYEFKDSTDYFDFQK